MVVNVCSFVVILYILAVVFKKFKKLFKEGPHLIMKIGLVSVLANFAGR